MSSKLRDITVIHINFLLTNVRTGRWRRLCWDPGWTADFTRGFEPADLAWCTHGSLFVHDGQGGLGLPHHPTKSQCDGKELEKTKNDVTMSQSIKQHSDETR